MKHRQDKRKDSIWQWPKDKTKTKCTFYISIFSFMFLYFRSFFYSSLFFHINSQFKNLFSILALLWFCTIHQKSRRGKTEGGCGFTNNLCFMEQRCSHIKPPSDLWWRHNPCTHTWHLTTLIRSSCQELMLFLLPFSFCDRCLWHCDDSRPPRRTNSLVDLQPSGCFLLLLIDS